MPALSRQDRELQKEVLLSVYVHGQHIMASSYTQSNVSFDPSD